MVSKVYTKAPPKCSASENKNGDACVYPALESLEPTVSLLDDWTGGWKAGFFLC